ncbi:hypothetical protein ACLOJK_022318 [Asimina triloba]
MLKDLGEMPPDFLMIRRGQLPGMLELLTCTYHVRDFLPVGYAARGEAGAVSVPAAHHRCPSGHRTW